MSSRAAFIILKYSRNHLKLEARCALQYLNESKHLHNIICARKHIPNIIKKRTHMRPGVGNIML